MIDYVQVIGLSYPAVMVVCFGDPSVYANIQWEGGDPLPPEDALIATALDNLRLSQIAMLSDVCQNEIRNGFTSAALGTLGVYDSQEVDQLNLVGTVAAVSPTPSAPAGYSNPYAVRQVVDGVIQPKSYQMHTYGQMRTVLADGVTYKLARLQKFNNKRDYINNTATTPEQIQAVTWESTE